MSRDNSEEIWTFCYYGAVALVSICVLILMIFMSEKGCEIDELRTDLYKMAYFCHIGDPAISVALMSAISTVVFVVTRVAGGLKRRAAVLWYVIGTTVAMAAMAGSVARLLEPVLYGPGWR